jgi:hypothetical protein
MENARDALLFQTFERTHLVNPEDAKQRATVSLSAAKGYLEWLIAIARARAQNS